MGTNIPLWFRIAQVERPSDESVLFAVSAVMKTYPEMPLSPRLPPNTPVTAAYSMWQPSHVDIRDYNRDLNSYYEEYRQHLFAVSNYQNLAARTILLKLLLCNNGNWPAEDIHVMLHFPDGFELRTKENRILPPAAPEPPSQPIAGMPGLKGIADRLRHFEHGIRLPQLRLPDSGPTIRKTHSYDVEFHVKRLKHGFTWSLDTLFLTFDSYETAQSFPIDFRINAGNMPEEALGKVHVIVEKAEVPIPREEFEDPQDEEEKDDSSGNELFVRS